MIQDSQIRLHDLRKTFPAPTGPVPAVRGVDLAVGEGETVALLGPNGAGKSTTIDMLLGLLKPDAGDVSIFGRPPSGAVERGLVGAMLQTGGLLRDLTVRELLTMMASLYPSPMPVQEAIDRAAIGDVAERRTERLSGGQTQRVRFAVALISNPNLLVLDEPTAAMDVESRHAFWATMREMTERGRTVLFATHYMEEAESFADRVVLMASGRVVADGPTAEIKAMVGLRTIRATLPDVAEAVLERIPGVVSAERRGPRVILRCDDSDAAIRELLISHPGIRDIEIAGAALEDAFLQLTREPAEDAA